MSEIVSTKETPGPFDALVKAEDDEPIFTLLGRDPCAPATITEWTRLRRRAALSQFMDRSSKRAQTALQAELVQCAHAEGVAFAMESYRAGLGEAEAAKPMPTYSGNKKTETELAEAKRAADINGAVRSLREAAYHICNAKDAFAALGADPVLIARLGDMLITVNAAADDQTPHRAATGESS